MKKHRTFKAVFAAVLAALMALAVFPVSALPAIEAEKSPAAPYWTVPEGYNAHDYNKCVEFLEQEDENGVKNGQKLNPDYDPNDPETWISDGEEDLGGLFFDLEGDYDYGGDGYKLCGVFIEGFDMVGELDLAGCSCLFDLFCYNNRLTEIDLSETPIDRLIIAEGDGYVGFGMLINGGWGVHAQALYNNGFDGFYDADGEMLMPIEGFEYVCECSDTYVVRVRFEYAEPTGDTEWWTPFGYDPHDYEKCVAFLEQKDENGVKNGEKLRSDYHPAYPKTWNTYGAYSTNQFIVWQDASGNDNWDEPEDAYSVQKLKSVKFGITEKLIGTLDLSGCALLEKLDCQNHNIEALNVSDCAALEKIICQKNQLSELNVSNSTALKYLYCFNNNLTELDVSGNPSLLHLICNGNELTELDVSGNTALEWLDCYDNELTELDVSQNNNLKELLCEDLCVTELDLSNNPELAFDLIVAEGPGTIGYADGRRIQAVSDGELQAINKRYLYAFPQEGARFEGFYDENGELLSQGSWKEEYQAYAYLISSATPTEGTVTARFAEASDILGDIDGDGELSNADALMLMRYIMGQIGASGLNLENADMNGDGAIEILDALLVLRVALGEV